MPLMTLISGTAHYNLVSDQFTGLHGITVPGTLRDSLVLLAVALEQQTELQPTQIMTDTGAYSDVVFGLFRLLGYRFSPARRHRRYPLLADRFPGRLRPA